MVELFANSGDPDPMLHYAASDLGLHCLLITILGVKFKAGFWISCSLSALLALLSCNLPFC